MAQTSAASMLAALFLLAALAVGGRGATALERIALGAPELAGLRAEAGALGWTSDGALMAQYSLQWTQPQAPWELRPQEPVNVSFWDTTSQPARLLSVEIELILLPSSFLVGTDTTAAAAVTSTVPAGATAVSFALGTSGLETRIMPLPAR